MSLIIILNFPNIQKTKQNKTPSQSTKCLTSVLPKMQSGGGKKCNAMQHI